MTMTDTTPTETPDAPWIEPAEDPCRLPQAERPETAEQRVIRLAEALVRAGLANKIYALYIIDAVIKSDRDAGCDPEVLRGDIRLLEHELARQAEIWQVQSRLISESKSERDEARAEVERLKAENTDLLREQSSLQYDASMARGLRDRMAEMVKEANAAESDRNDLAARLAVVTEAAQEVDALLFEEGGVPSWNILLGKRLDSRAPRLRAALTDIPARAAAMLRVVEALRNLLAAGADEDHEPDHYDAECPVCPAWAEARAALDALTGEARHG